MSGTRLLALVLVVAGALALAYGGFQYTRSTHDVKLGPIEVSVSEKRTMNIPVWAGGGALIAGVLLLALGSKR